MPDEKYVEGMPPTTPIHDKYTYTEPPVDPAASAKKLIIYSRVFGLLCYAILMLGIALSIGDLSVAAKSPISAISVSTTFFGLLGAIMSEITARRAESWSKKPLK